MVTCDNCVSSFNDTLHVDKIADFLTFFSQLCRELTRQTYAMSVMIMEAEYQFDRNKLTIYYDSTVRIDFRELVRDLFSAYKTRIWLKKYNVRNFHPKQFATMALATGVQFQPER